MSAAIGTLPVKTLQGAQDDWFDEQVVSMIRDSQGNVMVLSRARDQSWNYAPYFKNKNKQPNQMRTDWPDDLPPPLLKSCKRAAMCYWRMKLPGRTRPTAGTVISFTFSMILLARWLAQQGRQSFAELTHGLVKKYVSHLKTRPGKDRDSKMSMETLYGHLGTIQTLYAMKDKLDDCLPAHPWPDTTKDAMTGRKSGTRRQDRQQAKTDAIPDAVASDLFKKAEGFINRAGRLLATRNYLMCLEQDVASGKLSYDRLKKLARKRLKRLGYVSIRSFRSALIDLQTSGYVILGMISGMRDHELASVPVGAYYETTEEYDEVYGWLKGESHKTGVGATEWMVPPIAKNVVAVLERYAEPMRAALTARLEVIDKALAASDLDAETRQSLETERHDLERHVDSLFLMREKDGSVHTINHDTMRDRLNRFAKEFGWHLHPHQFRRTFAVFVACNALGDLRYLRVHYKHWSMDMTALYARNERQDRELYTDILAEITDQKTHIVERWLDQDTALAGGGAKPIILYRSREEVKTLKDRRALATTLSDQVTIRGTGHSWCMADGQGCGGQGLYEMTRCIDCGDGVIDETFKSVWLGFHQQSHELLDLSDVGPGGLARAQRDLERSYDLLRKMGLTCESCEKAVAGTEAA